MTRTNSHQIETLSVDIVRSNVNKGDALFREFSGRDYGVDSFVEVFSGEDITGQIAYIQIKGSEKQYAARKAKYYLLPAVSRLSSLHTPKLYPIYNYCGGHREPGLLLRMPKRDQRRKPRGEKTNCPFAISKLLQI